MKKKELTSTVYEYPSRQELTSQQSQLIDEARKAASTAYAPYSNFFVGAAVRLENQQIVHASNQENSAFPSGLCAERTAVFYANARYPQTPVIALAIAANNGEEPIKKPFPPCGACLQVLLESERRYQTPIEIILFGSEKIIVAENVEQFLPHGFTEVNLRDSDQ